MRYFPIFMDLQRQNVLVVGGGTVAERKIRLLLESGAIVHVAAQTLSENIAGWLRHKKIRFADDKFTDSLLAEAAKGRIVARLKGGDSFIFGRGGEKLEVLRAHGVEYEVVPGITAAVGCAAFAGIPLTHRDHAQALTFVSGHRSDGASQHKINWNSVAGPGKTVVVYMGLGQAENIRRELLTAGVSQYLPVALIADGTRDQQQTIHGTVSQLPAMANQVKSGVPGLLIIGQVAALRSDLGWFNPKLFLPVAA